MDSLEAETNQILKKNELAKVPWETVFLSLAKTTQRNENAKSTRKRPNTNSGAQSGPWYLDMRARPLPCLVSAQGHFVLAVGWRQTCCNAEEYGSFVFFSRYLIREILIRDLKKLHLDFPKRNARRFNRRWCYRFIKSPKIYLAGFMKTAPSDSRSPHTLNWLN